MPSDRKSAVQRVSRLLLAIVWRHRQNCGINIPAIPITALLSTFSSFLTSASGYPISHRSSFLYFDIHCC